MQFGRVSGLKERDKGAGGMGWVGVVEGESEENRRAEGGGGSGGCHWRVDGAYWAGGFGDVGAGMDVNL